VFKEIRAGVLDLIFPPICILCRNPLNPDQKKEQICSFCQATIVANRPPFCSLCSRPLFQPGEKFCDVCQQQSFAFQEAWAACLYNDTMRRLIHLFKYGQKTQLRYFFIHLINDFLEMFHVNLKCYNLVVPVPLHATRYRERGYNQAQLLAQILSEQQEIPLSVGNLLRMRNTKNQAILSPKERWTNIASAFKIKSSSAFTGRKILVVDDLLTTGATGNEIAKVLINSGAQKVGIITIAIAPKGNFDPCQKEY
jgi:competence protein ComFC